MKMFRPFILTSVMVMISFAAVAKEQTLYIKKLVDPSNQSMLLLACTSEDSKQCRVLGGGSFSAQESQGLQALLRHRLQFEKKENDDANVRTGLATCLGTCNPLVIGLIIMNPIAGIGFVVAWGVGSYVVTHWGVPDTESDRKLEVFSTPGATSLLTKQGLEQIDQDLIDLRQQLKRSENRQLRLQ